MYICTDFLKYSMYIVYSSKLYVFVMKGSDSYGVSVASGPLLLFSKLFLYSGVDLHSFRASCQDTGVRQKKGISSAKVMRTPQYQVTQTQVQPAVVILYHTMEVTLTASLCMACSCLGLWRAHAALHREQRRPGLTVHVWVLCACRIEENWIIW